MILPYCQQYWCKCYSILALQMLLKLPKGGWREKERKRLFKQLLDFNRNQFPLLTRRLEQTTNLALKMKKKKGKWEEKRGGGGWRKKSLFGWESEKRGAEGINLSAKIIRRDSEVYRMTRKEWKTRCQFHQRSTYSFCTRRSQKRKKYS